MVGTESQKQVLGERYSNNPLALKIVAASIRDLFDGEIGTFLQQDTLLFNGMRRLLEQQFERLSPLEQSVMNWLAINREWTTIAQLQEDIVPTVSQAKLLEALEGLTWRSLLEKQSGNYTQQPVVMEYVTEQLIQQMANELTTEELDLLNSHALLKTTVKDYIRESQSRLILQPIADLLRPAFSCTTALAKHIQKLLALLRESPHPIPGYAGGNLINLCVGLQLDLTGADFSELTIWHAYLQSVNLHRVNFAKSQFAKSVFTQTFGAVYAVAFSPDGQLLATGEASGEIRLWRVADHQPLLTLKGHTEQVWSVEFSPFDDTGKMPLLLASGSADQTVKLWDIRTGQLLRTLPQPSNPIWAVGFSPFDDTGKIPALLASGGADQTVKLWDVHTGQLLSSLQGHTNWVMSIVFSPFDDTGKMPLLLASGSADQTVKLWDVHTGQLLNTLQGHTDQILSVAFSPDGTLLASGSTDYTVKLWDVRTGQLLSTLQGHTNQVWSVGFSPDGSLLASGGQDCTVKLWDVHSRQLLRTLQGHTKWVHAIRFSGDGITLASGSSDQTVKLWDIRAGQLLRTLQGYTNWVLSVTWNPDGTVRPVG